MPTVAGKQVSSTGLGLMGMTWRASPPPYEQSFAAMKAALAAGCNFWNGGELYGPPDANSLHLLNAYFSKYPDDADKVVISIKGGLKKGQMIPDGSPENVRRSVEDSLAVLEGKKSIDLFECARVDPNVPIEETIKTLGELVREGKIGAISLSEVTAEQIRKAYVLSILP